MIAIIYQAVEIGKKRKERKDKNQPRMKVAALKVKNKERYVLVNAGWKKLDPNEVIIL